MNKLFVGFKGKNNASSILVRALSQDCILLTNSFIGLKKDIDEIADTSLDLFMFGIDKRLQNIIRIESYAEKDRQRIYTKMDIDSIAIKFDNNGIDYFISKKATHYLCNEAYWYALKKFDGRAVFIHIPSIKYINKDFIDKMKLVLI
jgi:hypothetical protein